uniref:Uncharacterized protein n=1 Tax=Tetraselmis sp. GSL018 TaxID=582737 RepID=A0A061QVB5_9CHLO
MSKRKTALAVFLWLPICLFAGGYSFPVV